jgi:hypothetical protein
MVNIAADLGGMAEATMMMTGAPVALMVPVHGVVIVSLLIGSSYRSIARVAYQSARRSSDVALRASWRTLREDVF